MTFKEFLKRIADKWFCLHKWELEEEFVNESSSYKVRGFRRIYNCKCGSHKVIKIGS